MTDKILTLIAAERGFLTAERVECIRRSLGYVCAEIGPAIWLSEAEACDIVLHGVQAEVSEKALLFDISDMPVDAFVQTSDSRRKKLFIADMDSTIITAETLDEMARAAGVYEAVAALTHQAMNGEVDFHEALYKRVALLEGITTDMLEKVWHTILLTPGAETVVNTMRRYGTFCVLASGGFTFFAERVAAVCGFDAYHANHLDIQNGTVTGGLQGLIFDQQAKYDTLHTYCARCDVPLDETLAVGDGVNDLLMLKAAGLGVAYHAKPRVRSAILHQLNFANLAGLLFAQGYHRDEFV